MNIGKTIRELRKQTGYSQLEFAEIHNLSASHLSQLENGRRVPNISYLNYLCEIFEIPLCYLLALSFDEQEREKIKNLL